MCTVTYIPQPLGGFVLTSNRDESPARATRNLDQSKRKGQQLLFPRDSGAGGTWIVVSDADRTVCLLNGAFVTHKHQPPYKKSRGIMVLEFFDYPTVAAFAKTYDFGGMEPFTMIVVERGEIQVLRWDETQLHREQLDPRGRYIWSSVTLYSPDVQGEREQWFLQWLAGREDFSQQAILNFHRQGGGEDSWNGFIMNRNDMVRTVSLTSIRKSPTALSMYYESLMHKTSTSRSVEYSTEKC